jgi:hypothetical protein
LWFDTARRTRALSFWSDEKMSCSAAAMPPRRNGTCVVGELS